MKKIELLAPAGTYDCVLAAVNSGADAVYFAGQSFGARSFAGNLTDEEIYRAADFCHIRGAKSYLTVNTLLFDREFADLDKFISVITKAGVDGVIVQDLGVLKRIRELSPDIELHASTQMTVHSADGVRQLEEMGVSRVVLSRELSGEEIRSIIKETKAETEVFVHGAMCMSYSGQCLLSSVIGSRSGNRGKCAQPCRLPYEDNKFYLSLKDMSYAEHITELSDMGVASLKIEGRMKGEAYVSAVVSAYRRLIDENRKPTQEEINTLNRIFFRGGLSDGYYTGKTGKDMFAFDKPDNPYLKNDNKTEIPDTKRVDIEIFARFKEGEKPYIKMTNGEFFAENYGENVIETAGKRPATRENILSQLLKLGDTPFVCHNAEIELSENAFVPVSVINELRRCTAQDLEEKILLQYKNKRFLPQSKVMGKTKYGKNLFTCSVLNEEQYMAICDMPFEKIYVPLHIVNENMDKERVIVALPAILRKEDRERCKQQLIKLKDMGFKNVAVSTIDALDIAEGFNKCGTFRLNVTNSLSFLEYNKMGLSSICLSPELNLAQIRDIDKDNTTEVIAYGRLPLMTAENCILKNMDKCTCNGMGRIKDRTGREFIVIKDGDICRSVVLNSVPLYMGDKIEDLKSAGIDYLCLMFTDETKERCREISENYINSKPIEDFEYTRLQFYRKALA